MKGANAQPRTFSGGSRTDTTRLFGGLSKEGVVIVVVILKLVPALIGHLGPPEVSQIE